MSNTPRLCATCDCFWKAATAIWPISSARQMERAAEEMRFEEAAGIRDLLMTVEELDEKQKMAAAEGNDADIFGYYAEPPLVAVNLFHMRNGHIVDRREFFWEDQMRLRRRGVLRVTAEADLSGAAIRSPNDQRPGGFRRPRTAGRTALGETRPPGGHSYARSAAKRRP